MCVCVCGPMGPIMGQGVQDKEGVGEELLDSHDFSQSPSSPTTHTCIFMWGVV